MKESEIEKILVDGIRKLGGKAYKFVSPGNDGVPDRLVILKGEPAIFVELKTDTGRLSARQKIQIQMLHTLGQIVIVIYGEAGVRKFLKDIETREELYEVYTS